MDTCEIRQYTDDEGKLVTARVPVDPITLQTIEKVIRFFGTYNIPHPQMGAMRIEFEFPNGWILKQCFDEFKTEAEKDFNRLQEEARKEAAAKKLWTPGSGNGGGLIVPK